MLHRCTCKFYRQVLVFEEPSRFFREQEQHSGQQFRQRKGMWEIKNICVNHRLSDYIHTKFGDGPLVITEKIIINRSSVGRFGKPAVH